MKKTLCLFVTILVLLGLSSCGKVESAIMTVESGDLSLEASGYDSNDVKCSYEYIITNSSEFEVSNIELTCALVDIDGMILGTTSASVEAFVGSGEKVRIKGSFSVAEYKNAEILRIDSIMCKNEKDNTIKGIVEENAVKNSVFDLRPVHNTISKMNNHVLFVIERLNKVFTEHGYRTLSSTTSSSQIKDHEIRHYINDWVELTISLESNDTYVSEIGLLFHTENQTSSWKSEFFEIFGQIIPAVYSNVSQYDAEDAVEYYEDTICDGYNYSWPEYKSDESMYNVGEISCSVHKALGNIIVYMNLE